MPHPHHRRLRPVRRRGAPRHGFTLLELVVALCLAGVLAAVAFVVVARALDRVHVRAAAAEVRAAFALARHLAVLRGTRTAVRLDADAGALAVHVGGDTALRRPLAQAYGVTLLPSRDSAAYAPSGLGFGASNLRAVVARGSAAETVVVSRLGRVR